jgi:hypothetical protein
VSTAATRADSDDIPQSPFLHATNLTQHFPMYKTRHDLSQTTKRVHHNIERGFQVNKLQSALRLAMEKGDVAAMTKIRAALDQVDSMQELPVQAEQNLESME